MIRNLATAVALTLIAAGALVNLQRNFYVIGQNIVCGVVLVGAFVAYEYLKSE